MKYRPRGDFVIYQVRDRGLVKGLQMPDSAVEGKERIVVALGPEVKDLELGDMVLTCGQPGMDLTKLPEEVDLYLTRQANVVLVILPEPDNFDRGVDGPPPSESWGNPAASGKIVGGE